MLKAPNAMAGSANEVRAALLTTLGNLLSATEIGSAPPASPAISKA